MPKGIGRPFNKLERMNAEKNRSEGKKPGSVGREAKSKNSARKSGIRSLKMNEANPRSSSNTYLDPRRKP